MGSRPSVLYVYSVNVPVPGRVRELAAELYPQLHAFDRVRSEHSCVLKRLGDADVAQLQRRAHRALEGAPAVEARIATIDYFEHPPLGTAPVVYLAVESPGLEALHSRLLEHFDPIDGIEGSDYVPHVTLARGGDLETARALASHPIDPLQWTVSGLEFWDGHYKLPVSRVSLPA